MSDAQTPQKPVRRRPPGKPSPAQRLGAPTVDVSIRVPLTGPELDAFTAKRQRIGIPLNLLVRQLMVAWTRGDFKVEI